MVNSSITTSSMLQPSYEAKYLGMFGGSYAPMTSVAHGRSKLETFIWSITWHSLQLVYLLQARYDRGLSQTITPLCMFRCGSPPSRRNLTQTAHPAMLCVSSCESQRTMGYMIPPLLCSQRCSAPTSHLPLNLSRKHRQWLPTEQRRSF